LENTLLETNPISDMSVIKDYIEADLRSVRKQEMQHGSNYFEAKHDIRKRKITHIKDLAEIEDKTKANRKLTHPYHRILVLQKAAYIVGKPIVFAAEGDANKLFVDRINEMLGDVFNDKANIWVQGAANKGIEWLHTFIDKAGDFRYCIIPAQQIIPIYDSEYEEDLEQIIRYYSITVVDGNKTKLRYKVELWDKEKVTYYMQQDDDSYALDLLQTPNPCYHWYSFNTSDPETMKENSWGRIPFIALENNDECMSDLNMTKSLIDDYDLNVSDFSNNLAEIQELIWVLRGYEGSDLNEFMHNLKTHKAIKLAADENSGATTETADLPHDSKDSHLNRLEDNIYIFGMGVNMNTDKFGNSPSGIALKFMYQLLDLNASILIRKMKNSLKELMYFVTTYINLKDKTSYDPNVVTFTFNLSMVTNTTETITDVKNSVGVISDETIVAHHPWVTDPKLELERLDAQRNTDPYGGLDKSNTKP
jgi:SPP1 family phage portal protein